MKLIIQQDGQEIKISLGTGGDLFHLPDIHIEDKKNHNTGG